MRTTTERSIDEADSAAVFAVALSVWEECQARMKLNPSLNLSETYHGMDQLMRIVMSIGYRFESWACKHVDFDSINEVRPYLLEDQLGDACLKIRRSEALEAFDDDDCLRVALLMKLPVFADGLLPVPVDERAPLPNNSEGFVALRIQTVRDLIEESESEPYVVGDDPFDDDFNDVYFGLYGVFADGLVEHIASRRTYLDAVQLAQNLVPGIDFPAKPRLRY